MAVNNPDPTYYEVLGVEENASLEDIEKAFKIARRDNHPHKGAPEWAFRQVTKAYETLKDDTKRKAYDQRLKFGNNESSPEPPKPPTKPTPEPAQTTKPPTSQPKPTSNATTTPKRPTRPTTSYRPVVETQPQPQTVSEQEDIVQVEQYENNFSHLEDYSFTPSQFAYLPFAGIGLVLLGISGILLFLDWSFPTYPNVIGGVALVLAVIGALMQLRYKTDQNASKISIGLLVVSWILVGVPLGIFLDQPTDAPMYLIGFVLMLFGSMIMTLVLRKYTSVLEINKKVPVKTLRNARIYGQASGENEQNAALLRNISSTLQQVTNYVDGTFLLHLQGLPVQGNKLAPVHMILLNGNRMAAVSLVGGSLGDYAVDESGNLIQRFSEGFKHIPNHNPEVLMALQSFKNQFKDLETKSFVIVVNNSFNSIKPYQSSSTEIFSRKDGVKVLSAYFKDSEQVVRRDVLSELTPLITV